jgi:uncharacterized protein YeaC (DUF1315 family)
MSNRHLLTILLACLGIISIISLQGSQKVAQVLAPMDSARNPVNTVQSFYKAVERGEWLQARAYTTRECWNNLQAQGLVKNWQEAFKADNSFDFAGFSVDNSQIERQEAVINGRAVWLSAQGTVPRVTQTITLQEGLGGWRISSIQSRESAGVVESFYAYLDQGQWDKAKALVQPETWRKLESQGTLSKIKSGFGKATPYVTFKLTNIAEEDTKAQIQGDTVWKSAKETKAKVTITLSKKSDKWVIQQFDGGWPK